MAQDRESLSRLTLRQLRLKASDLGIPLYSRKTKSVLANEILLYQERKESENHLVASNAVKGPRGLINNSFFASKTSTRVVFLPRDPEWAYVFWEISETDRKSAQEKGASRLCLRLADVTTVKKGAVNPGTLREVIVDSHSTEWYLPIPIGDRDYRVELGYRFGAEWISLAFSSIARVPSLHPSEQILDQFVPFSLEATTSSDLIENTSEAIEKQDSGLHERLYQTATTHFEKTRVGSEEFQQGNRSSQEELNDSGSGLWASGLNQSGIGGLQPRERSFWLVADAELIVYGSTDPSAKLTIGGEEVPLAADGTFRLQVPFRDGSQNYLIQAEDSTRTQKRNVEMKFERITPEDNTNPIDQAKSEWF
ncbi:DUF4912 domain-containing protein [Prochlorococcus marinus]|uniref:Rho termination factor N-terminal domain-containing protein n=1 Tax=Prochlorococcus marinus (strain MIT 9211) TaxID=93059 RepID=A9B9G0_PROM4|nr:DUF4912 domain-containing protein [Prochlorococcus marinus]ABX08015.1 Conserved hypothetical protein [Prochlorococcus marinus str. MIT 9211]